MFILVLAERPYVQFAIAHVTGTWFAVGVTNRQERERIQVSGGRSGRVLRARLPLSRVLVSCSCVQIPLFMGRPASPFVGEGKTRVTDEEKEKNEREEGFQGCRVLLLHAGPADPIDINRNDSIRGPVRH